MRRIAAAVLGTIAGTALLVGAKAGTRPPVDHGALVSGPPGDPTAEPSGTPSGLGRAGTPTAAPSGTATTPGPTKSAPRAVRSTAPAPAGGSSLRSGTYRGTAVTHKYGTLQVTITVSGGTISNVAHSYSTTHRVSEEINADALPKLRQEALAAQSAKIATVSGATYTSDAYRTSLQSAIDKAKG